MLLLLLLLVLVLVPVPVLVQVLECHHPIPGVPQELQPLPSQLQPRQPATALRRPRVLHKAHPVAHLKPTRMAPPHLLALHA